MAHRVHGRDEFVPAGHFVCLHRAALLTDEPAQARRIHGDRTLQAPSARLRLAAPSSPAQSAPSAVIAWAGHRPGTLANRCRFAPPLPLSCPWSQRCPARRRRDR